MKFEVNPYGYGPSLKYGKRGESGVWRALASRRRILWRGHDSLYVALGRWRFRWMKPGR